MERQFRPWPLPQVISMVAPDAASPSDRIGPFTVSRTSDELELRQPQQGELGVGGCMLFAMMMLCVLVLGIMSIIQPHTTLLSEHSLNTATNLAPGRNLWGALWLVGCLVIIVALPLYVVRAYGNTLVYRFQRTEDSFWKGKEKLSRLRRVRYLSIRESKDPQKRYLYRLNIAYNDGQEIQIHASHDEREILNLGKEISSFVGCPIQWNQ